MTVTSLSDVASSTRQNPASQHLQDVFRHTFVSTKGAGAPVGLKVFIGGVKLHDDTAWIAEDVRFGEYLGNAVNDRQLMLAVVSMIMFDPRILRIFYPDPAPDRVVSSS